MSNPEDKKISKIDDDRLVSYTNRTRNGSEQVFYTGTDCRDFKRYRAEGGHGSGAKMHDKADTIKIQPPSQSYYAELIDGEWWWLDGCDLCNGRPRHGWTYMGECDAHNVCRSCGEHRSNIKGTVWGGRKGWQCEPCQKVEHEIEKQDALDAMPEEFNESDFHYKNEITCPHCAYEFSDSWECSEYDDDDRECPRCDNVFKVTAVVELTFNCDRKEPVEVKP